MKYLKAENTIVRKVADILSPYGFVLMDFDLKNESSVNFIHRKNDLFFVFGIQFLEYSKTIAIEPTIFVSYDKVTQIVKDVIGWEPNSYGGWLAISARIGDLINPKNKNGFFNDNDCPQIEFSPTDANIDKAIINLKKQYFDKGAVSFMEKTDTIEKADILVNEWVVKSNERIRKLAYCGHIPWQITTGIILAKLVNRKNYTQLRDRYVEYASKLDPNEYEWIRDFNAFVEYFEKRM